MRITDFDKDVENISKLSDRPNIENGYTSENLRALFDKAGRDIKAYINNILISELESSALGASGADKIGTGDIPALPGRSVQEKLESMAGQIQGLVNGNIPDGTVTPEKFSPEISAFLTSASVRSKIFKEAGSYEITIERDGTYKITMVGAGAGGTVVPNDVLVPLGGGGGAGVILWLDLKKGDVLTAVIGKGGEGIYDVEGDAYSRTNATEGENSTLSLNSTLIATAEGGKLGKNVRASAEGGDFCFTGGYPVASGVASTNMGHSIMLAIGGESILGRGGVFRGDVAGSGGGGYGAAYTGLGYYDNGDDGGDGALVIEFIS